MKRVAVIPLKQFLDARSDSELLTKLATSVERTATLKMFDRAIEANDGPTDMSRGAVMALKELRRIIEQGKHV